MRHKTDFLELLFGVAKAANEAASVEEAFGDALERVCRFMGWPVGHAYLTADDPTELVPAPIWHLEEPERFAAFREATDAIRFGAGEGLPGRVLVSGEPAWVEDVSRDSQFYRAPLAAELGLRAGMAFPVLAGREVVAVLEFYARESAAPEPSVLDLMANVGTLLGRVVERTRSAAERRASEEWVRQVVETAHEAFISIDARGEVQEWNPAAEATFGWSRQEALGRPLTELIVPERHRESHDRGMAHFLATGEGPVLDQRLELPAITRGGREIPVEMTISAMRWGETHLFNAFLHDISERKRTEEEMREREKQLAEAQQIARLGSWEWDIENDRVTWSDELYRIYGLDPSGFDADFESFLELVHPDDRELTQQIIERAYREGTPFDYVHRHIRADGSVVHLHARGEVILEDDRPVRMIGTAQDVTERHQAQERERQLLEERIARREVENRAEELARLTAQLERSNRELDQFAYVASHDLKAPLRGIANLAQWIEEDLDDRLTEETREHLALLHNRVHRMEALIDGLLAYSRIGRQRAAAEELDLGELVRGVVELLAPPPEVTIEIDSDLPTLTAERPPLEQVFHNLLGNAIKFHRGPDARISVTARRGEGGWQLSVTDNGPGIAPRFHGKIWEMFQTLKARDEIEGSGLGLALVKKIAETHGGRVWVESEEDQGASFHVLWPDPQRESIREPAGETASRSAGSTEAPASWEAPPIDSPLTPSRDGTPERA